MTSGKKLRPDARLEGALALEEQDDDVLLRWFYDAETDLDVEAARLRMSVALCLVRRVSGAVEQGYEPAFLDGVEAFAAAATEEGSVKLDAKSWADLLSLAGARSLELGHGSRTERLLALGRCLGEDGPGLARAEACFWYASGSLTEAEAALSANLDDASRAELARMMRWKRLASGATEVRVTGEDPAGDGAAAGNAAFHDVLAAFAAEQDTLLIVRSFFGTSGVLSEAPRFRLLGFLMLVAVGSGRSHTRVQTPKNVKRRSLAPEDLTPQLKVLLGIAVEIEALDAERPASGALLKQLQLVEAESLALSQPEERAIVLMALRGLAARYGQHWAARGLERRYASLCLNLTAGADPDVFGLAGAWAASAKGVEAMASSARKSQVLLVGSKVAVRWLALRATSLVRTAESMAAQRAAFERYCGSLLESEIATGGGWLQKLCQLGSGVALTIPEPIRAALASACRTGRVMTVAQLEAAAGGPPERSFKGWQAMPLAVGSIAQLHRAVVGGKPVVVKIKHAGIEREIEADIRRASRYAWIAELFFPGRDVRAILKDWQTSMLKECDLGREAVVQRRARDILRGARLKVPEVIPSDVSGEGRLFVQEFIDGESFEDFIRSASSARREAAALAIVDGILRLNRAGIFYNDIHPGNLLFTADDVYLVDFGGALTREEEGDGPDLFTMVPAVSGNHRALVAKRLTEFGSLPDATETELDEMMTLHADVLLRPFLGPQPFKFSPEFARTVVVKQYQASRSVPRLGLPKRAYLGSMRIFWSLYSLLGEMGAEADWAALLAGIAREGASERPQRSESEAS